MSESTNPLDEKRQVEPPEPEEPQEQVEESAAAPQFAEDQPPVAQQPARERRRVYINTNHLPYPTETYVAWLDVMGSRSTMATSLLKSSNNIGRLHIAILMNRNWDLQTSPFMDGAYIRSPGQAPMLDFLWGVFEEMAYDFLNAREHRHRFMPRCGLAFGGIIEGVQIPTTVSKILGARVNSVYREGIYFGYPMVQAFRSEGDAPPFGIAINESARGFAPYRERPLSGVWWRWHIYRPVDFLRDFVSKLMDYFDWCEAHSNSLGYPIDRIRAHRAMAAEYFDTSKSA
jgi:hypothetical protein